MILKNRTVLSFACLAMIVLCIVGSGCSTNQDTKGSVQGNPSNVQAPLQPQSPTTMPVTIPASMAPTTVPTAMVTTTITPNTNGLSVSLNSAVKKINIGGSGPMPGNILLVLDISIQNNDKNEDFDYTDASFVILDKTNKNRRTAITSKFPSGLNNPLASGKIPLKSKITGQVVFGVNESSNSYKFYVSDTKGTVITSVDNINVA